MYNIHLLGAKLLIRHYLLFLNGGLRDRIPSFIVTFLVLLVVADAFRSFHCDSNTNLIDNHLIAISPPLMDWASSKNSIEGSHFILR